MRARSRRAPARARAPATPTAGRRRGPRLRAHDGARGHRRRARGAAPRRHVPGVRGAPRAGARSTSTSSTARELVLRGSRSAAPRYLRAAVDLLAEGLEVADLATDVLPLDALRGRPRPLPPPRDAEGGAAAVRAAIFHAPLDVRIEDRPEPEAGPGELVIRIDAALTCGTDAKTYSAAIRCCSGRRRRRSATSTPAPCVAAGAGAPFAVGTRVCGANSAPCGACAACLRGREELCANLLPLLNGAYAERLRDPRADRRGQRPPAARRRAARARRDGRAAGLRAERRRGERGARRRARRRARPRARSGGCSPPRSRPAAARSLTSARATPTRQAPCERVIEAAGTVEAWERAVRLTAPGGTCVLFGGLPRGDELARRRLPPALRGADAARRLPPRAAPHAGRARPDRGAPGAVRGAPDARVPRSTDVTTPLRDERRAGAPRRASSRPSSVPSGSISPRSAGSSRHSPTRDMSV